MKLALFLISAIYHRWAYIDVDGTLLRRLRCPLHLSTGENSDSGLDCLDWWMANLNVRPLIYSRLAICYFLWACDVTLVLWTNRTDCHRHRRATWHSLGKHRRIFTHWQMRIGDHDKLHGRTFKGPCMDDQKRYTEALGRYSLWVEQL